MIVSKRQKRSILHTCIYRGTRKHSWHWLRLLLSIKVVTFLFTHIYTFRECSTGAATTATVKYNSTSSGSYCSRARSHSLPLSHAHPLIRSQHTQYICLSALSQPYVFIQARTESQPANQPAS